MALEPHRSLVTILTEPLRHENFRKLLIFLGSWNFAVNLAAPFFTVYMLQRLELSMAWVLGLSVISQISNISLYRVWGELADRLGNKSVLGLSGWLFVVCIGLWPFTTLPEKYFLTIPLLIAIHVLAGISTAGVNLCASGITLKLAPRGKATAFLAVNALISGLAATVAPAVAGFSSDWFASRRLSVELKWSAATAPHDMTAVDLSGLDFLFAAAVVFGLYSLHRLLAVREEGVIEDAEITAELYDEVLRAVRNLSSVAGLRRLVEFPYSLLRSRGDPESGDDSADGG
jgi:MFS family permease